MPGRLPAHPRIARGGKSVYGARLGILVLYRVVAGASPQRVVRERAAGLLDAFIAAARELVAVGADGITTNCGFLSLYQKELAAAVSVPVATSSLMQVPMIQITLPRGK